MTISEKLDILNDKMDEANSALINAIESTRPSAEVVNASPLLGGKTPATVISQVSSTYSDHVNSAMNPHGITPEVLGGLTYLEIQTEADKYLPTDASGIDRFGMNSHLEPNISGSFEGNNTWNYYPSMIIIEKNGTLILLRNGSDGSKRGVFYSYIPNALGQDFDALTHTTQQYAPGCLPSGIFPYEIVGVGDECFLVSLCDATNEPTGGYALLYTNGTGDAKAHQCGLLNTDQYPELSSSFWVNKVGSAIRVCLDKANNDVYLSFYVATDSMPFGEVRFFKHTMTPNDRSGGLITFAPLTAGGTQLKYARPYGDVYTSTQSDVKFFNFVIKDSSTALQDRALISNLGEPLSISYHTSTGLPPFVIAVQNGKLRFLGYIGFYFRSTSSPTSIIRPYIEVGFEIDLATNVVTHTSTQNYPLSVDGTNGNFTFNGVSYPNNLSQAAPVTVPSVLNSNHTFMIKRGNTFNFHYGTSGSFNNGKRMARRRLPEGLSDFDALLPANLYVNMGAWSGITSPNPTPGSITNTVKLVGFVPGGIIVSSSSITGPVLFTLVKTSLTTTESGFIDRDYGSLIGYPNTNNRVVLTDRSVSRMLNHITLSGAVTAYGLRYGTNLPTVRQREVNSNGLAAGVNVTVPESLQNNFMASAMSLHNPVIWNNPLFTTHVCEFAFDPLVPDCAICVVISHSPSEFKIHKTVFVSASTFVNNVLTGLSTPQLVDDIQYTDGYLVPGNLYQDGSGAATEASAAPTSFMEMSAGVFRVVHHTMITPRFGGTVPETLRTAFIWDSASDTISAVSAGRQRVLMSPETASYVANVPNVGYGTVRHILDNTGLGLLVVTPAPNALNGVTASSTFVIAQQKLKQGWLVYFTTEIPVILNGRKGVTKSEIVDLQTINPALVPGDTFYVYLEDTGTEFVFRVRIAKNMTVGHNVMYVGRILTDANGVAGIQIGNVTRLANYNLSSTPESYSIPVSGGNPIDPAKLLWS